MNSPKLQRQIWLDTDPGFDDWMAWALLEADPRFRVAGVSVVAGNAPLVRTLSNALRIKALHGFTTPVYAGCDRPLAQPQVTAQDVLGADAMASAGRKLPSAEAAVTPGDAVQALIDHVRAHPGQVTLLAIGPLTNVAQAFRRAPELPALLQQTVIMGGSTDRGNATAVAEFNIHADPEAAAEVFAAGAAPVMFGLNVCRQVEIGVEHARSLRGIGSERAAIFADHLQAYAGLGRTKQRMALYDPTPVAWLANPDAFTLTDAHVAVELDGRLTRGMTVCEFRVPRKAPANARIAMQVDARRVLDSSMATLASLLA